MTEIVVNQKRELRRKSSNPERIVSLLTSESTDFSRAQTIFSDAELSSFSLFGIDVFVIHNAMFKALCERLTYRALTRPSSLSKLLRSESSSL